MKIENDVFKGLFREIWELVMSSKDMTGTEEEWKKLLERGDAITNDPRYAPVRELAIKWIVSYVSWLENINRESDRKGE